MAKKDDSDNWLKYPEKIEPLKNIPLWDISNEKKEEINFFELLYKSDLLISRVEYLLFTNDSYLFEVSLLREAEWWSAQTIKFNLDRNADIMSNCWEETDQLSSDSIELMGLLLGEDKSIFDHLITISILELYFRHKGFCFV